MRVLSKEVFARCDGRPVCTGFVTYISSTEPVLMHCAGREDYSDAYDDYAYSISRDNGRTWGGPVLFLKGYHVEGGKVRFGEPAAFFDSDTERLIVLYDRSVYPKDTFDTDLVMEIVMDTYDPATGKWSGMRPLNLCPGRGIGVSFSFPTKTSRGRILAPAMRQVLGEDGKPMHYQGCWGTVDEVVVVIGEYQADGSLSWSLSEPVNIAPEVSSRGIDENTLAELRDGRIAMVCRGDNSVFPEKPGYKWLCFSEDEGMTWAKPVPFPCTEGEPIESSATGSAFFRSIKNDRLYWIGNLCIHGRRPNGNYPRSPLVVAEVSEEPFGIIRDSITVVDQQGPGEPETVQMSNFRFYQDRENGALVLFLTRYAERSAEKWMDADYYRYRVEID
jgi:hypothetical protein